MMPGFVETAGQHYQHVTEDMNSDELTGFFVFNCYGSASKFIRGARFVLFLSKLAL